MHVNSVGQESPVFLARYKPVFEDSVVDQLPGKVHVKIDSARDAKPGQCPPRRVLIAVKPDQEKELENLVHLGILKLVTEPTEWCSQISVQKKKNGKLRVCINPRSLNEVLQREKYPLPTIEDILPELANYCSVKLT